MSESDFFFLKKKDKVIKNSRKMNSISVSKYMAYNPLFNVSSFLQTSNHHSPSSTCSSNSSNSFSPNSSINTQCLPSSLNHSTLITQPSAQYISNGNLSFNSNAFCANTSPNSLLRNSSPSDLQTSSQLSSLAQAQAQLAAQMAAAVSVAVNGSSNSASESSTINQTTSNSPQLTNFALKQAALAALQAKTNSSNQILNSNRLEQSNSLLTIPSTSQQFASNGNHYSTVSSKSSFSPTSSKNFFYNPLKSSSAFRQTNNSSPNIEIMNLSNDQFKLQSHLASPQPFSINAHGTMSPFLINSSTDQQSTRIQQLDSNLTNLQNNLIDKNSTTDKVNLHSSSTTSQLTLDTMPDHHNVSKSSKRTTNRQGKSVRKSNHKDEFGFSKVIIIKLIFYLSFLLLFAIFFIVFLYRISISRLCFSQTDLNALIKMLIKTDIRFCQTQRFNFSLFLFFLIFCCCFQSKGSPKYKCS